MIYSVSNPRLEDLNPSQPWADAEFEERLKFKGQVGPQRAEAWKLRPEVWTEFAKDFSYTYGERYQYSLWQIIEELKVHPDSRQLFMSVWNVMLDSYKFGRRRVPCSLGYWFANRDGKLMITYLQRSADMVTHLENDQYLSHKLQHHIAKEAGLEVGRFTHWIGSLHAYRKDLADIF
jgi:thymidylate synthase